MRFYLLSLANQFWRYICLKDYIECDFFAVFRQDANSCLPWGVQKPVPGCHGQIFSAGSWSVDRAGLQCGNQLARQGFNLTLSPLAVNFEDRWWPMQTIWIQMKPHKMWGFIWDPNCLTYGLYISKIFERKQWFVASFERTKYLKKLPSMQRVKSHSSTIIEGQSSICQLVYFLVKSHGMIIVEWSLWDDNNKWSHNRFGLKKQDISVKKYIAPDKMHKIYFNGHYLHDFSTKSIV